MDLEIALQVISLGSVVVGVVWRFSKVESNMEANGKRIDINDEKTNKNLERIELLEHNNANMTREIAVINTKLDMILTELKTKK